MNPKMTAKEVDGLLSLVRAHCPAQPGLDDETTKAAWFDVLAYRIAYGDARTAINTYAVSEKFSGLRFRTIAPVDVLDTDRALRRHRNRGVVTPAPPDPDDALGSIAHQKAARDAIGRGRGNHPAVVAPERSEASERRRRALVSRGARVVEPGDGAGRLPTRGAREAMAAIRAAAPGTAPAPRRRRAPGAAGSAPPALGQAAPRVVAELAPAGADTTALPGPSAPGGASGDGGWCGRCHQDTGFKTVVDGETLVAVDCCGPRAQRAAG